MTYRTNLTLRITSNTTILNSFTTQNPNEKKNLIKIAISVRKNKNPDEISVEKRVPYNSVAVRTKRADRF